MDTLPSELIMLFVPDPDTLGRMLLVCKWILAALTAGHPFKLTESDVSGPRGAVMMVGNGAVSFTLGFETPWIAVEKVYGRNVEVVKYTFEQIYHLVGSPKYIRDTTKHIMYTSGIGWDTVNYLHKCVLVAALSDDATYSRARTRRNIVLVSGIGDSGTSADFNTTYITDDPNDAGGDVNADGLHLIYKRIR